ncbi:undecaprenyl-phosphate 4-deoxy-4-formamido-L-arabinose transferase [Pseudomonas aeruginosa]
MIPVYNEEASPPELLRRTEAACLELSAPSRSCWSTTAARDRSAELLQAAAERDGGAVVAVIPDRNYGQHAAILAGFEQSRGDLRSPSMPTCRTRRRKSRLVERAAQGYDVVGSIRAERQDSPGGGWPSRLVNLAVQRSTGVAMHDCGCMLRAYRRSIVEAMLACRERSTFIPDPGQRLRPAYLRDPRRPRRARPRRIEIQRDAPAQPDVRPGHLHAPPRRCACSSLVGGGMALAGFLFALFLLVLRLAFGAAWAGNGLFVLFAVLFMFSGVQLLGMGPARRVPRAHVHDVRAAALLHRARGPRHAPPRFPRPCSGPVSTSSSSEPSTP